MAEDTNCKKISCLYTGRKKNSDNPQLQDKSGKPKVQFTSRPLPVKVHCALIPIWRPPPKNGSGAILFLTLFVSFFLFSLDYKIYENQKELNKLQHLVLKLKGLIVDDQSLETLQNETIAPKFEIIHGNIIKNTLSDGTHFINKREINKITSGYPLDANFIGSMSESITQDGGLIGPWFKDKVSGDNFSLGTTIFKDGKASIVIMQSGTYFIYGQGYYYSNKIKSTPFSIDMVDWKGLETTIRTCSVPWREVGEANCYTGSVLYLRKGTKIQMKQIDGHVFLNRGKTFLGLVLLSPAQI